MKNKILGIHPLNTDMAALLLRLLFGGLFIYHGYDKIINYDKYLPMFTDIIGIGIKLSFNLLIFAEFFCGILVAIGLVTRLAVIPIAFSMGVAYFIALAKNKFVEKELVFLLLLLPIVIFILGSGRFSVDRLFQKRKPSAGGRMV